MTDLNVVDGGFGKKEDSSPNPVDVVLEVLETAKAQAEEDGSTEVMIIIGDDNQSSLISNVSVPEAIYRLELIKANVLVGE